MGTFLYEQLGDKGVRFDSIPESIKKDQTKQSLRKIMTNLAFLWLSVHGQTFSIVSVCNACHMFPAMMRKPITDLNKYTSPINDDEKAKWLPSAQIIKDVLTLAKTVTYRADSGSVIS